MHSSVYLLPVDPTGTRAPEGKLDQMQRALITEACSNLVSRSLPETSRLEAMHSALGEAVEDENLHTCRQLHSAISQALCYLGDRPRRWRLLLCLIRGW